MFMKAFSFEEKVPKNEADEVLSRLRMKYEIRTDKERKDRERSEI